MTRSLPIVLAVAYIISISSNWTVGATTVCKTLRNGAKTRLESETYGRDPRENSQKQQNVKVPAILLCEHNAKCKMQMNEMQDKHRGV